MQTINALDAQGKLNRQHDAEAFGKESVMIPCAGTVAGPTGALADDVVLPDRSWIGASLLPAKESANRALRNQEHYR